MSLSVGIVGLPNVGKSTLFNALLGKQQALSANYPFATIEPNVGVVPVVDGRLGKLAEIVHSNKIVNATVEFLDIAGLVAGAHKGEGLGNKFLANVRETDLICHVVRVFKDGDVVLTGKAPLDDYQVIVSELILKDLETVEKRMHADRGKVDKSLWAIYEKLFVGLNEGKKGKEVLNEEEMEKVKDLQLLTFKAEIVVANIGEDQIGELEEIEKRMGEELGLSVIGLCAKIEEELVELSAEDRGEYLRELGMNSTGLDRLVKLAYDRLGLISFLTAGEKEVKAWTVKKGSLAPIAAGVIHTDFEKKFIKAKVVKYDDFVECGGWKNAADKGNVGLEGREYVMQEGDVVEFMIGN